MQWLIVMTESRITNFLNIIHFLFIINIYPFLPFDMIFFYTQPSVKLNYKEKNRVVLKLRIGHVFHKKQIRPRPAQGVLLYSVYNNVYANTRGGWWKRLWGVKLSVRKEEPWPTLISIWGFQRHLSAGVYVLALISECNIDLWKTEN